MKLDVYIEYLNSGIFCESILKNSNITEEDFLLELVNKTRFKNLKGNRDFKLIEKQSNKENDITNGVYSCDFKLVVSSDFVWAESDFRHRYVVQEGGVIYGYFSKKAGSRKVVNLAKAIRITTIEEMIKILKTKKENLVTLTEKAMKEYINNLKKDKNLFLFIPAKFLHKSEIMNEEEKEQEVLDMIYEGFKNTRIFRNNLGIKNNDLFITFIYNGNFIIIEILDDCYQIIDK
ncbi:MAG: hypothetical protein IJ295_00565, partial [Clostridia bacterium]|nr:hypothetical protein [Clostridia bacterium]